MISARDFEAKEETHIRGKYCSSIPGETRPRLGPWV